MAGENEEFGESFEKKQKELLKKQEEFETEQRLIEKSRDYIEKKEKVKLTIINWLVILITLFFLIFLGITLL